MKNIIIFLFLLSVNAYAQIELPRTTPGDEIVRHSAYTLKYNEKYEEADWVAYKLTADMVRGNAKRPADGFKADPLVPTKSAETYDYSKSGYARGHLCPAADFKSDQKLMNETFYMSNMTPMKHVFNAGIWENLEDRERKWATENQEIYVVTGPILKDEPLEFIGRKNRVAVAKRFYKIILDYKEPELKMIAFVIPHDAPQGDISVYAMTVRDAERITGFDFFQALPDDIENKLETELDMGRWGLNPGAIKYAIPKVETAKVPEDYLNKQKPETQTQAAIKDDQNIFYVVVGVGLVVIVVLGIVIFVGLRMNKRR
ncbi:MAG: DNA/RNA non-specific endonuclease [Lentisphaerae bacterium]|nr:DNA/RNA non-specific endonuclease [Lentisphaerota bacterium]